ncbi:MAG: hypothetical protein WC464_02545 [Bdellovibrionales bacterium]
MRNLSGVIKEIKIFSDKLLYPNATNWDEIPDNGNSLYQFDVLAGGKLSFFLVEALSHEVATDYITKTFCAADGTSEVVMMRPLGPDELDKKFHAHFIYDRIICLSQDGKTGASSVCLDVPNASPINQFRKYLLKPADITARVLNQGQPGPGQAPAPAS